jgi:phospholipid transport system substrate-binding protein
MLRHSVVAAWALAVGVILTSPPACAGDPTTFIAGLDGRLQLVVRDAPENRRPQAFRELLRQSFDVPLIARFVFGRYWRTATLPEQQQLVALFEDYLVLSYSGQLSTYADSGRAPIIIGSRPLADGAIVSSEIILGRGPTQGGRGAPLAPVRIDWRLVAEGDSYKIIDVVIDGISMAATQRSEFAADVERGGGELPGLVAALQQRTAGFSRGVGAVR